LQVISTWNGIPSQSALNTSNVISGVGGNGGLGGSSQPATYTDVPVSRFANGRCAFNGTIVQVSDSRPCACSSGSSWTLLMIQMRWRIASNAKTRIKSTGRPLPKLSASSLSETHSSLPPLWAGTSSQFANCHTRSLYLGSFPDSIWKFLACKTRDQTFRYLERR